MGKLYSRKGEIRLTTPNEVANEVKEKSIRI